MADEAKREGGKKIQLRGRDERETENPKVEGYAAKSLLRMVDFPEPEGPDMTIGRWRRGTRARAKGKVSINSDILMFNFSLSPKIPYFSLSPLSILVAGRENDHGTTGYLLHIYLLGPF